MDILHTYYSMKIYQSSSKLYWNKDIASLLGQCFEYTEWSRSAYFLWQLYWMILYCLKGGRGKHTSEGHKYVILYQWSIPWASRSGNLICTSNSDVTPCTLQPLAPMTVRWCFWGIMHSIVTMDSWKSNLLTCKIKPTLLYLLNFPLHEQKKIQA